MKPVKVSDLKDQTGMTGPRPFLRCRKCTKKESANKGDYFAASNPDYVFTCCGEPMELVIKRVEFIPANP